MNKKQIVRLTESDLNNIIKESVMEILKENPQNEGLWDYFKSMGRQGGNKAQSMGQQVGKQAQQGWNAVKGAAQRGVDAVRGTYNNAAQGVKTMHQNAMQDSSMANMQASMNKFQKDLDVYLKNGGQVTRQLKSQVSGIMNMLNGYQEHA